MIDSESVVILKIEELSLLLVRMALQNSDYSKYSSSLIVASSIFASISLLRQNKQERQND